VIGWDLGGGLPATPEEATVACVVDHGRVAIASAPVVQDQCRILNPGLVLALCHIRPIPDIAGAGVIQGRFVEAEGAIVAMIFGIVGQGHLASCD